MPQPPAQPDFDFHLETPQRSAVPRAVDEIHFKLKDIHVVGATKLSAADFRPLYADLIGKDVTLSSVLDVADAIEQMYRAAGYALVRAYVPPQRVADGVFTIDVSEGSLRRPRSKAPTRARATPPIAMPSRFWRTVRCGFRPSSARS